MSPGMGGVVSAKVIHLPLLQSIHGECFVLINRRELFGQSLLIARYDHVSDTFANQFRRGFWVVPQAAIVPVFAAFHAAIPFEHLAVGVRHGLEIDEDCGASH